MYGKIIGVCVFVFGLSGCAMLREGNPVLDPGQGPGTGYPCGYTGVVCTDAASLLTPDAACCPAGHWCAMDDGGPYCAYHYEDPMSPTYSGAQRIKRYRKDAS